MKNDPLEMLRLFHAELVHIRRDIHANPELGFEEQRTSPVSYTHLTLPTKA